MSRRAGVALPLFSVRRRGSAIGEICDLADFARWASAAGFHVVQILPVSEPAGGQNSPYSARTAFALDPVYLSLEACPDWRGGGPPAGGARVDWHAVRAFKRQALREAHARFATDEPASGPRARELTEFVRAEADWLEDYALFVVLHERLGDVSWVQWPRRLRDRDPGALAAARREHAAALAEVRYVQWQLERQWHEARRRAAEHGVALMGDLPFMVAEDSACVWARRGDFRLDARVGVPPDAFSADGQDWGLPAFAWDAMAANDFAWMRARARRAADLFDAFRVDHVVGLYRTFYRRADGPTTGPGEFSPAGEPEQLALGERVLRLLAQGEPGRVIAEDLGTVPDFVRASLGRLGIPGYRVLRWEKDDHVFRDPAAWPAASVATTGTHDTSALADWWDELPPCERRSLLALPALAGLRDHQPERFDDFARDALLELVYDSGSDLVLIPFQDAFGARDRINVPGTVDDDNWSYRVPLDVDALLRDDGNTARLRALAQASGRI
jgi:4-alpha-glucanotransferase